MHPTEAIAMISVFGIVGVTMSSIARAFFNRPGKRSLPAPSSDPLLQERLDRLESAVQAIAIETERIAEGQRFTTRLLSQSAGLPGQVASAPRSPASALPATAVADRAS